MIRNWREGVRQGKERPSSLALFYQFCEDLAWCTVVLWVNCAWQNAKLSEKTQSLNTGVCLVMPAIMAALRSLDINMAAFQVAM